MRDHEAIVFSCGSSAKTRTMVSKLHSNSCVSLELALRNSRDAAVRDDEVNAARPDELRCRSTRFFRGSPATTSERKDRMFDDEDDDNIEEDDRELLRVGLVLLGESMEEKVKSKQDQKPLEIDGVCLFFFERVRQKKKNIPVIG